MSCICKERFGLDFKGKLLCTLRKIALEEELPWDVKKSE